MKYKTLGRTDLTVSTLCLGSMTWGSQNTPDEGHAQIDVALDHGINFVDTAEMYPAMPGPGQHWGDTEIIIGDWLEKTGRRGDMILATKIVGEGTARIRDGAPVTSRNIPEALDGSLKRLKTDYVDLYQIHWPNRGSYHFRKNWAYDPTPQPKGVIREDILDILGALAREVEKGRIRAVGLSNETAWGTAQFLRYAEEAGLPRMATIQNEYSLLCRWFDLDLAEVCHHEDVDLICYSPMACGILSGKYAGGAVPEGSRMSRTGPALMGRVTDNIWPAHDAYLDIARRHGLDPSQMALAWCLTRPFMGSAIFGATSLSQLEVAIGAADLVLSDEVMGEIAGVYRRFPAPI